MPEQVAVCPGTQDPGEHREVCKTQTHKSLKEVWWVLLPRGDPDCPPLLDQEILSALSPFVARGGHDDDSAYRESLVPDGAVDLLGEYSEWLCCVNRNGANPREVPAGVK